MMYDNSGAPIKKLENKIRGHRPIFVDEDGGVETLRNKITEYFRTRKESGLPLTIASFVLFLGTNRMTLRDYINRAKGNPTKSVEEVAAKRIASYEEACKLLEDAVAYIEDYYEQQLSVRNNAGGAIFWLKNHGWKDETTVEHAVSDKITGINYVTPLTPVQERNLLRAVEEESLEESNEESNANNSNAHTETASVLSEAI